MTRPWVLWVRGAAIAAWILLAGGLAALAGAPPVLVAVVAVGAATVAAPAVLLLAEAVARHNGWGRFRVR